jgi:hypothetical protein
VKIKIFRKKRKKKRLFLIFYIDRDRHADINAMRVIEKECGRYREAES